MHAHAAVQHARHIKANSMRPTCCCVEGVEVLLLRVDCLRIFMTRDKQLLQEVHRFIDGLVDGSLSVELIWRWLLHDKATFSALSNVSERIMCVWEEYSSNW